MNGTYDNGTTETHEDEGGLDPHEAARLLEQTRRQAQRGLDFRTPWLTLLAAAAALVAFGSVWLSVRAQHPYKWPTPVGLLGLYAVVAVRIGSVPTPIAAPAPASAEPRYARPAPRGRRSRWRCSPCTW
jgi:hypothetical protein